MFVVEYVDKNGSRGSIFFFLAFPILLLLIFVAGNAVGQNQHNESILTNRCYCGARRDCATMD